MGAMEDAANLFSQDMGGTPRPAPARSEGREPDRASVPLFEDRPMEGDADAGNGETDQDLDEGGDYAEEQRRVPARKEEGQRRGDDGRFLKNEGPIGDEDEGAEGEGGESREEGEEAGEDAEPSGRAAEIDPNTKVVVKIDGQDREVTFKEATEGYIRTQTFHQRMTALDNERQVVERDKSHYANTLAQSQQGLERILAELKAVEPAEPNWDELYRTNPNEAARQKILWDRYKDGRRELEAQHQEVTRKRQEEHLRGLNDYVGKEAQKILTKFPHWKEQGAREKDQAAIKKTLKDAGFSDQEVSQLYDSRMVVIAMKAARFDRLSSQAIRPNKSTNRPMPTNRAASRGRSNGGGDRAFRDHASSQTVESAAGAFQSILAQEG